MIREISRETLCLSTPCQPARWNYIQLLTADLFSDIFSGFWMFILNPILFHHLIQGHTSLWERLNYFLTTQFWTTKLSRLFLTRVWNLFWRVPKLCAIFLKRGSCIPKIVRIFGIYINFTFLHLYKVLRLVFPISRLQTHKGVLQFFLTLYNKATLTDSLACVHT